MGQINATDINPSTGKAYAINPSSGVWDDNFFDSKYGAANRSDREMQNAIAAPTQFAQGMSGKLDTLFGNQRNQETDYLNRYSSTIAGQESTDALAKRIGDEVGLPQLQANSQSLNRTMFNLPSTYSKAMTGFDINQNQLDRTVGTKQAELAPAAALASDAAQRAEQNVNTRLGYAQRDQDRALLPFEKEGTLLQNRLAREASGYTEQMQSELSALISKAQMGVQLSEGEKNRAQELALAEAGFENQMKLQTSQQDFQSSQPDTETITVGGRIKLIDKKTGNVIKDLGASGSGGSGSTSAGLGSYYGTTSSGGSSFKPITSILDYNNQYFR